MWFGKKEKKKKRDTYLIISSFAKTDRFPDEDWFQLQSKKMWDVSVKSNAHNNQDFRILSYTQYKFLNFKMPVCHFKCTQSIPDQYRFN